MAQDKKKITKVAVTFIESEKCPKCGSLYLMEHRFDSSVKLCMKCHHNYKL